MMYRVGTDLGTDSGSHPVHNGLVWCRSMFVAALKFFWTCVALKLVDDDDDDDVDQHWSKNSGNKC